MQKIAAFIVTKDRPMQYHGCLDSLLSNCPVINTKNTFVLAKYSDGQIKDRYNIIHDKYPVALNIEDNFNSSLKKSLKQIADNFEYVLLMTDDTIYYRGGFHLDAHNFPFIEHKELFTYSLRLGRNTVVQDIDNPNKKIGIPQDFPSSCGYYLWEWQKASLDSNMGYPISMDGHVYNSKVILDLCDKIEFRNLREWEGNLIGYVRGNTKIAPLMACPIESYCVNIPYNMVQPPNYTKIGPYGMSLKMMNTLFDDGYRFDNKRMFENISVIGSHQYVQPYFKKEYE